MSGSINIMPSITMEIHVLNGKLRVDNFPKETIHSQHIVVETIKAAVLNADLTNVTKEILSEYFFMNDEVIKDKTNNGIVETPDSLARFIVSLAFNRWVANNHEISIPPSNLHWLDPCSGAGVFPCKIIEFYINSLHATRESDLPLITVSELSPAGLISTLCTIKVMLERNGLNFSEYLGSGRLTLLLGDSLSFFPELQDIFNPKKTFDIIVGNPPYVRSTRLKLDYKQKLAALFPDSFSATADLYTYFVSSGIANLKHCGVLAFVSPATFLRAKNGHSLRELIKRSASVDTFIDLDETKVFEKAELHTSIYALVKGVLQSSTVHFLHIDNVVDLNRLYCEAIYPRLVVFEQPVDHGWAFHSSELSFKMFSDKFTGCKSLSELGVTVYSGIRSGYSKAYIIDKIEYKKFDSELQSKWFKPAILPANIKRWHGAKRVNFMLVIPSGTDQIDDALMEYLIPYKEKLISRTEAKNVHEWFTLRTCTYYKKMNLRKIAFPDLSAQQRFSIVDEGVYIPDGAYFIDSDSLVLLGILNSGIAREYFVKRCSSVGNLTSKGRFRFKKSFVQALPVPKNFADRGSLQDSIIRLVQAIMDDGETEKDLLELDRLVTKLYQEAK